MASPNLSNVNSLYSLVVSSNLSTAISNVLLNPGASNASYRISSIVVNNGSSVSTNVFVWHAISGSILCHNLVGDRSLISGNVNRIVSRSDRVVLDEGDSILANTESNVGAIINVFYEDVSEFNRISADFLLIGGGGGGAGGPGGGGGGGGFYTGTTSLSTGFNYSIIVGGGGTSTLTCLQATNGSPSCVQGMGLTYLALGGGGGASATPWQGSAPPGYESRVGSAGGSAGGGSGSENASVTYPRSTATVGINQGNGGGSGTSQSGTGTWGGGGGGAGEGGQDARFGGASCAGYGGNGKISCITGTAVFYAGGGGGGTHAPPTGGSVGGLGGGGRGNGPSGSTAGNVNTGGGGGGCGYGTGCPGGSGIVVFRYLGPAKFNGGNITNVGGYTIHTFYNSGNLSLL